MAFMNPDPNLDNFTKRKDLHDKYGGSRQSGISPCSKYPFIFIFTYDKNQNGYKDFWDSGIFKYSGEGRKNHMTFTRGNKALLNHYIDGKRVFLFKGSSHGKIEYKAELVLAGYENIDGNITFNFAKVEEVGAENWSLKEVSIDSSYRQNQTERLVRVRQTQSLFRGLLLQRFNSKCCVTGLSIQPLLVASHIVPWSQATDQEKIDVNNGLLLSPNLDKLFDNYLISFDESGKILISSTLGYNEKLILGLSDNLRINNYPSFDIEKYMLRHRQKLLQ